ncbi:MAG: hypothetical protein KBD06_03935 [Candidatus Pacebacteria bacterium]|nr:hypothetical protein [Candidatus Paceibacterota bacterium]
MNRMRNILYEGSVIFLTGVIVSTIGVTVWNCVQGPTIEDFKREYAVGDVWSQKAVAEKYMRRFAVPDLLKAVEEYNAAGNCHSQGHGIGRAIYDANPNFTAVIRQCGGTCTQGCFHGAMMEMFQTESDTLGGVINDETPEAYLKHIQETALDLCKRPEVASEVLPRYCTHGLGHAFAYFSPEDMDEAIRSCEMLETKYASDSCASGAFMEYLFNASSSSLMLGKGAAPCDRYPTHTQACYQYKAYGWVLAWGGVKPAIRACDSFGTNMMTCIFTVAQSGANIKLLEAEQGFDSLCGGLEGDKHSTCVRGALFRVIDLNDGDEKNLCARIDSRYSAQCAEMLESYQNKVMYAQ